jgi:hypothetical protein
MLVQDAQREVRTIFVGGFFHLPRFYPALMILVGAHYLPFVFLYGMRMFAPLSAILVGCGVVIALYFAGSFPLGGWIGALPYSPSLG